MSKIELRLFGAFRKYSESPSIVLDVPSGLTVAELKPAIAEHLVAMRPDLGGGELVFDSALASEQEILSNDARVDGPGVLAILPPVCGG